MDCINYKEQIKELQKEMENLKGVIYELKEENEKLKDFYNKEIKEWEEENNKILDENEKLTDCIDSIYVRLELLEDSEVEPDISVAIDAVEDIIKEHYPEYFYSN